VSESRSLPISLTLLWLVGNALRLPILAVPPVIPMLRNEFQLSGVEIGILTGLPVVLFAAAALAGSRLVALIGVVPAAIAGMLLTAVGSALRGGVSDVIGLFAATAVMSAGVAITQPAMPALVGRWLPQHIALGTAVYTNGLLVGEIIPVGLFPVLFPVVGASWRAFFVLWAVPIAGIAMLVLAFAPRRSAPRVAVVGGWWPRWRLRDIARLGLVFGATNALYFASNAFLPGELSEAGRADLITPALTALNLGQLPASFLLIAFARRLERKRWPFVLAGVLAVASIAAIVFAGGMSAVAGAALLGFSAGGAFALGLTLPPLLSAPGEVARVSAGMFTVSYSSALVISILSGAAWDLAGSASYAFLPIALSAVPLLVLVLTISFDDKRSIVRQGD